MPRRFGVYAQPATGESLASWVDRTAAINELQRREIWFHLGIIDNPAATPVAYGVTLDVSITNNILAATGMTTKDLQPMLLSWYDGTALDLSSLDLANPRTVRAWARTSWAYIWGSHACPVCLGESAGVWQLRWKTPWAFACTRHEVYLIATCPDCGTRLQSNTRDARQQTVCCGPAADPQRSRRDGTARVRRHTDDVCGLILATVEPTPAGPEAVRLQAAIDSVLDSDADADTNSGSLFADLRQLLPFVLYTGVPGMLDGADKPVVERFEDHIIVRDNAVARRGPMAREQYRSYGLPPTDPLLVAAALVPAGTLAFADDLDTASTWYLDHAAAGLDDMPSRFRQLDKFWKPPPRLEKPLRKSRDRHLFTVSASLDGRASRRTKAANSLSELIPGLLWPDAYRYLSAGIITGGWDVTNRRFAAIALARTLQPALTNWAQAAQAIGHPLSTHSHSELMIHKIRQANNGELLGQRLDGLARQVISRRAPINYGNRRTAFAGLFDLEPEDWATVCNEHGVDPNAGVWSRHRHNAAAWLWTILTAGDWHRAPALALDSVDARKRRLIRQSYEYYFVDHQLPKIEIGLRELGNVLLQRLKLDGPLELDGLMAMPAAGS